MYKCEYTGVCECVSSVTVFANESMSKPEVDIASIFFLVFEMQWCHTHPSVLGCGDLNSGPNGYPASTLLTAPSFQPDSTATWSYYNHGFPRALEEKETRPVLYLSVMHYKNTDFSDDLEKAMLWAEQFLHREEYRGTRAVCLVLKSQQQGGAGTTGQIGIGTLSSSIAHAKLSLSNLPAHC